jgi:beta-glucosidase
LLSLKFKLGLFENPYANMAEMNAVYQNKDALETAYQLAAESIVLLKNENNLLPLSPDKYKKVAIIGPNGDTLRTLFGGYSLVGVLEMLLLNMQGHSQAAEGIEMSEEMKAQAQAIASRLPSPEQVMRMNYPGILTVTDALREALNGAEVIATTGCDIMGTDKSGFDRAKQVAGESEIAILVVGGKNGSGEGCSMGENVDASSVGLPGVQEDLIKAVHEVNKNLIVVHMDGRPLSSVWVVENVPAIIEAWHPGQCGAKAIADVLTGKYTPGGKLAITAVRDAGQIPIYADQLRGSGTTGRGIGNSTIESGYVDQTGKPLYPFGYGLSYTTFALDHLEISKQTVAPTDTVEILLNVTNTGDAWGEEVVQLYYSDVCASMVRPAQDLAGFARVRLLPGETKQVRFVVKASQFAFLDKDMKWKVEKGEIEVRVGVSSTDIRLTGSFEISDDSYLPTSERGYYAEVEVI